MPRRLVVPLIVLVVLATPAAAARAATGGLSLRPSRVEAEVHRGGLVPPVTVENTSDRPVLVTAQALEAHADLSGQPVYDDSRAAHRTGDALLRPSPRRFVLAPGQRRRVRARVLSCPRTGRGTYAVLSFTATQRGAAGSASIQSALRLTAPLLLSYSSATCLDGGISELRGEQTGSRRLSFLLRVRNNGELHQRVHAGLAIRHGARTVFRGPFPAENVLPQSERELELVLPARLRSGNYTAVASTRLGPHASRRAWRFHLTGTNALPTPRLALAPLHAAGLHRGERPEARATVRNAGTGAGAARVRFSIARLGSGLALETKLVGVERVQASAKRDITARFASLPEGAYQLSAELVAGGRVVETRRLNVEVTAPAALRDRLRDWISAHLLATLFALVLAVALGTALVVRRRRPQRPSPVPAPPVPRDELAELRAQLERLEQRAEEAS